MHCGIRGWAPIVAVVACGGARSPAQTGRADAGLSQHVLTVQVEGNGKVQAQGGSFSCSAQCQQSFAETTQVRLLAEPAAGSVFVGWQGVCSGTAECVAAMNSDVRVVGTFAPSGCAE